MFKQMFTAKAGSFGKDPKGTTIFVVNRDEKAIDVWAGLTEKVMSFTRNRNH